MPINEFQPPVTCEKPNTCPYFGCCQRAEIIRQETVYAQQGVDNGLKDAVDMATCQDPNCLAAIEAAQPYLSSSVISLL